MRGTWNKTVLAGALAVALGAFTACGAEEEPAAGTAGKGAPQKVSLLLSFLPDMVSIPYLLADDLGYFEQCGIDFSYKSAAQVNNPTQLLLKGEVDFAILDPLSYIAAKDKGLPVISVAEDNPNSPVSYASRAQDGIQGPEALPGKIVGIQPGLDSQLFFDSIVKQQLPPDQVEAIKKVPVGFDIKPLMSGTVDVITLWPTNTNINELQTEGEDFNLIRASEYGIDVQGGLVVTTERQRQRDPEMVKRFVAAVVAGITAARDPKNADRAVDLVLENLDVEVPRSVEKKIYSEIGQLLQDPHWEENGVGWHNPEAFAQGQQLLIEAGEVDEAAPPEELYSNEVLQSLNVKDFSLDEVCG